MRGHGMADLKVQHDSANSKAVCGKVAGFERIRDMSVFTLPMAYRLVWTRKKHSTMPFFGATVSQFGIFFRICVL